MQQQVGQQNRTSTQGFPEYLRCYESLVQHFRGQLEGLCTTEKGDRFARFVRRLVPQTEVGSAFLLPTMREKKSSDEGVDLIAEGRDGRSVLCVQSRLWIDRADNVDSILSKFSAYLASHGSKLSGGQYVMDLEVPAYHFLVATLSPLVGVLDRYEKREFASKEFYHRYRQEGRLHFIHGHDILAILQAAYRKISELPSNLVLNLETKPIRKDNVFIGMISSAELQTLYGDFGESLFFENIRDFLGTSEEQDTRGRVTPNDEIVKTILDAPDRMLERNNGVVFRAAQVEEGDSEKQLLLSTGSVVNGCQTTMCLVRNPGQLCYVPVKVVEASDAWDIAKAANLQNAVKDIDLELARNLRPQLAKRAAAMSSVQIDDGGKSAFQIMEEIYSAKVAYEDTRLLYIGLFSRAPNNVFATNYTELRQDLIQSFYKDDPYGTSTFEVMFALQEASQEGVRQAQSTFSGEAYVSIFERFYTGSRAYKCFATVLALCGATGTNIADRHADTLAEYARMQKFLGEARRILDNRRDRFLRYFTLAVETWMQEMMRADADETRIRQRMFALSRGASFTTMFRKLCLRADGDDWLRRQEEKYRQRNV